MSRILAKDRCFIASSREFEGSWSDLNSSYSVMTKALLEGLDPNRTKREWITNKDLAAYVTTKLKGELQVPICTNFGNAINLTRLEERNKQETKTARLSSDICPYKGLEYFDFNEEDPKYFFGRER